MKRFPEPEVDAVAAPAGSAEPARRPAPVRPGAVLIPFPAPGGHRRRGAPSADEPRGEILFFLGVRYERLAS